MTTRTFLYIKITKRNENVAAIYLQQGMTTKNIYPNSLGTQFNYAKGAHRL